MNLGINPSVGNNYSSMNCKKNNSPNFGMAMKVDKSAEKVIKEQVLKLNPNETLAFWEKLGNLKAESESNPVNWIIRKCKHRNALAAEVVDSSAETAVKNKVHSQPFLFKTGNLEFAEKAKDDADKIRAVNVKIASLPKAGESDFCPGGICTDA